MKLVVTMQRSFLVSALVGLGIIFGSVSSASFAATPTAATTPAAASVTPPAQPAATAPATATTPAATTSAPAAATTGKAPAAASSLPAIAQAIWVKGSVSATQPGGQPRILARRSVVYEHDVVSTDKTSSGEIGFTDGSLMSLNPDSAIKIDEYAYKQGGGKNDNKSVMALVKGGFRTITGAIPKENPDGYKINTPVATIGVRGTEYATVLSPTKGLLLKIEKGTIKVANSGGTIDISKCDSDTDPSCQNYGIVKSFDLPPEVTDKMPAELANVAPVVTLPSGFGQPGQGPESAPGNKSNGPTKSVGSFCVGLLEDFMSEMHKFLS
jgi:hypothetical protein